MKKYKPTTPGRRGMTVSDYSGLSKVRPHRPLTKRLKRRAGRNSRGRITVRHQGGGHKRLYRLIDFLREKRDQRGIIETIEYDPYRSAFIALVRYSDGDRRYILAPHGLAVGQEVVAAESAPLTTGNRLKLKNIPVGYQVYNVELYPGHGGQMVRSAGSGAQVLAHADGYTDLKLSSAEVRKVRWDCYASVGQVSNPEHNLTVIGKAGRARWLGRRPTVRGSAMNPVDHPYGGGEGRTQRGTKRPKTKWGKVTGGRKTRKKRKPSSKLIVKRRIKKSRK